MPHIKSFAMNSDAETIAFRAGGRAERTACWFQIMKAVEQGELAEPQASARRGLLMAAAMIIGDDKAVELLRTAEVV